MSELILTNREDLKAIVKEAIQELETERQPKIYTINQARKICNLSHSTLKKHIAAGLIKTTKDNRITAIELNEFLKTQ